MSKESNRRSAHLKKVKERIGYDLFYSNSKLNPIKYSVNILFPQNPTNKEAGTLFYRFYNKKPIFRHNTEK